MTINQAYTTVQAVSKSYISTRLAIMMFLQLFIWSSWSVTLGLVMAKYKMENLIGDAYSTAPIASILSPFILGLIIDRYFSSQKVLGVLHFLGAVLLASLPTLFTKHMEHEVLIILFTYTVFYMPTLAISNTISFRNLDKPERNFPIVRVFGTVGWIVAGVLINQLNIADNIYIFYCSSSASLILSIYSFTLPNTPPPAKNKSFTIKDVMCIDAIKLMKNRNFAVFTLCSIAISIPLSSYYAYTASFLNRLGMTNISSVMSLGQVLEIIFMLLIPTFFSYLGVKKMLLIGMFAWFIRYALFSLSIKLNIMSLIYAGILIHGICYDFFFVVGSIYTDAISTVEVKGQTQSFIVMCTYGIGMLIGAQLSGALYNNTILIDNTLNSWSTFWWIPAIFAAIISIIFYATFNYRK